VIATNILVEDGDHAKLVTPPLPPLKTLDGNLMVRMMPNDEIDRTMILDDGNNNVARHLPSRLGRLLGEAVGVAAQGQHLIMTYVTFLK
jgi:hypothetical protein